MREKNEKGIKQHEVEILKLSNLTNWNITIQEVRKK